jgi:hypothetical protein
VKVDFLLEGQDEVRTPDDKFIARERLEGE